MKNPWAISAQVFVTVMLAPLTLLFYGCGGEARAELDKYLDELEFDAPLNSVEEVELGAYYISSAVVAQKALGQEVSRVWVRIRFELFAAVAPEHKKAVLAALERHRGMIDDAVLTICRKTSINELDDSRWTTIKAEITDAIRPLLGEHRIRKLFFGEFKWEPL